MNHKQLTDIHIPNADDERLALLLRTRENLGSNILKKVHLQICDNRYSIEMVSANDEKET
jgi:hypothetical protein